MHAPCQPPGRCAFGALRGAAPSVSKHRKSVATMARVKRSISGSQSAAAQHGVCYHLPQRPGPQACQGVWRTDPRWSIQVVVGEAPARESHDGSSASGRPWLEAQRPLRAALRPSAAASHGSSAAGLGTTDPWCYFPPTDSRSRRVGPLLGAADRPGVSHAEASPLYHPPRRSAGSLSACPRRRYGPSRAARRTRWSSAGLG